VTLSPREVVLVVLGVPECWVVGAETLTTRVHREPTMEGYRSVADVPPGEPLVPLLLPSLSLALASLRIA